MITASSAISPMIAKTPSVRRPVAVIEIPPFHWEKRTHPRRRPTDRERADRREAAWTSRHRLTAPRLHGEREVPGRSARRPDPTDGRVDRSREAGRARGRVRPPWLVAE